MIVSAGATRADRRASLITFIRTGLPLLMRSASALAEPGYPPQLPEGKHFVTDTSDAFLEATATLKDTWNGNRGGPDRRGRLAFDTCALTVIHIPKSERRP